MSEFNKTQTYEEKYYSEAQVEGFKAVIIAELPFSELVRSVTKIERTGLWYAVRCPFHNTETTDAGRLQDAADSVNGEGVFFCNSSTCEKHKKPMSIFSFWKEYNRFDSLVEAIIDLYANRLKKALPQGEGTGLTDAEIRARKKERRKRFLMLHVAFFYYKSLHDEEMGAEGRQYIVEERKIPLEYAVKFKLGYAPGGGALRDYLLDMKFSLEEIQEAKLLSTNGNDAYFQRIVFPLIDTKQDPTDMNNEFNRSNVLNLYSRMLPKYVGDNKAFKHRYLNNQYPLFNLAHARKKRYGLMVEGCFDTVAGRVLIDRLIELEKQDLIPADISIKPSDLGIFASYGTNGFKDEIHIPELINARFDVLFIAGDHDKNFAGQEANIKRGESLNNGLPNTHVRIVNWGSKDVNEFLVNEIDPIQFLRYIDEAVSLEEYRISVAIEKSGDMDVTRNQFEAIDRIEDLITDLNLLEENSLLKYMKTVKQTAAAIDLDVEDILMHIILTKHKNALELASANSGMPLKSILLAEIATIHEFE